MERLISADGKGYSLITRLFYANMVRNPPNEPFGFTTHIFGTTILINPAIIAAALNIVQEGDAVYPVHHWPEGANEFEY